MGKQYFKALKCTFPLHCCIVTGYGTSEIQKAIVLLHLDGLTVKERDYRLRIRIRGFEVTLQDEEVYSAATGF